MSPSPESRSADQYVYKPASAASTQRIIDEGVQAPSSVSFTSARASPTPSGRKPGVNPNQSATSNGGSSSYKQALADAEAGADVSADVGAKGGPHRGFPVRMQSWSEQDLKCAMQRGLFVKSGERAMQGFSEGECGEYMKGEEGK